MAKKQEKPLAIVTKLEEEATTLPSKIVTEDDAFNASDILLKVRKLFKDIEEKRKERTIPANETIKLINDDYNKYLKPLAETEKKLVALLEDYADARTEADIKKLDIVRRETGDNTLVIPIGLKSIPSAFGEVRFRPGFTITVTDATKVPKKYMTVDVKAIKEAVEDAGGILEIPGVEITRSNSASIYVK